MILRLFGSLFIIFIVGSTSDAFGRRSHHSHPQNFGYGQQQEFSGFRQNQNPNGGFPGQMEYGGLNANEDDYEGEIQQVSRDDDDFTNGLVNNIPPKYTQAPSIESRTSQGTENPQAVTPKGTFVGKKVTVKGKAVYAFYGIPYAKPPIGNMRFKRPEPADKLDEPFDAKNLPNACPQAVAEVFPDFHGEQMWNPNTNMSENCLFLNIWIPASVFESKETKQAPVLFWIYGGGFFSGSSSLDVYNGAKLAAIEEIVVVNVQYRLGPLGFLYFGNDDAPGNMGLLDQTLGLKWTRENIEYFGGDPNLVTLAGESCGAASVGFHLVSPISRNLFKRGIMTSGLPGAGYALKLPEVLKSRSYQLAKYAGCDRKTCQETVECLRHVDSNDLNALQWKLFKNILDFPFSPTIDGYFLNDFPEKLIRKGKAKRAELILGTVKDEGSYFILYHYLNYISHLQPTSIPHERFVEMMEELFQPFSESKREAIIDQYTNWENPDDGYINQKHLTEAVGDAWFVCPHRRFADDWSNRGLPVYYYHYTERSKLNPWGSWMGVMHGDDVSLLFGEAIVNASYPEQEKMMTLNFVDMIGSFMRTGVPSNEWERYTTEHPVYLDVNATVVSKTSLPNKHGPRASQCAFWNKLLPMVNPEQEFDRDDSRQIYRNKGFAHHACVRDSDSDAEWQNVCELNRNNVDSERVCHNDPSPQIAVKASSTSCKCTVSEQDSNHQSEATPPPL